MPNFDNRLFLGVGSSVVALDAATGQELWRTKLKTAGITTVSLTGGALYGAAGGEVFRLDPASGAILWNNKLKGLGIGVVSFPGSNDSVAAAALQQQQRAAAAAR